MYVIGIADPLRPEVVSMASGPGNELGVALSRSYAYVANIESGLHVIDIRNPLEPKNVGGVDPEFFVSSVAVAGRYAYIVGEHSLRIYPSECEPSLIRVAPDSAAGAVGPDSAAVAVAPRSGAAAVSPVLAYPNPAVREVTIHFELGTEGLVRAAIHDITGRRVRSLLDETLTAGPHELFWDARDDEGREVAPGVYVARFRPGNRPGPDALRF